MAMTDSRTRTCCVF